MPTRSSEVFQSELDKLLDKYAARLSPYELFGVVQVAMLEHFINSLQSSDDPGADADEEDDEPWKRGGGV